MNGSLCLVELKYNNYNFITIFLTKCDFFFFVLSYPMKKILCESIVYCDFLIDYTALCKRLDWQYSICLFVCYKTKDRVTRTPLKTGGELRCSGKVSSSCSTSDTRRFNLVTKPVISNEWGKLFIKALKCKNLTPSQWRI